MLNKIKKIYYKIRINSAIKFANEMESEREFNHSVNPFREDVGYWQRKLNNLKNK